MSNIMPSESSPAIFPGSQEKCHGLSGETAGRRKLPGTDRCPGRATAHPRVYRAFPKRRDKGQKTCAEAQPRCRCGSSETHRGGAAGTTERVGEPLLRQPKAAVGW